MSYPRIQPCCWPTSLLLIVVTVLLIACGKSDPEPTPNLDAGQGEPGCAADQNLTPSDGAMCAAHPDDYQPRNEQSQSDSWPACISDDNVYHPFESSISSNARVAAFEQIATLLGFGQGKAPSQAEFVQARTVYTEPEGLDSRVSRREDEHYPPASDVCRNLSAAEQAKHPERCVGPVQIQPLLTNAFRDGADGLEPALNAARIEAGLLWFLYVSVYKEATTCTAKPKDCDSASGYYAGVQTREPSFGWARYVQERSPQAHQASWDAILAVRCWRDLDNPQGMASDIALRDKARGQLDRALDRGLALIVRQRVAAQPCDTAWETVRILGPVLDRAATSRDSVKGAQLRTLLQQNRDSFDASAAAALLDELFPCP